MEEDFIEFAELVVDIAINSDSRSSLDLRSRDSLPPEHRGRMFPNVLSNIARRLNQALHIDEYAYQWFEYDFDKKIIVPAKNPAAVKEKAIDILTYATQHDCWNNDYFGNNDGQEKELIYLEKSYVIGLLNRHHIKNSFKPDEAFDARVEQQPQETVQKLCERLKGEGCKEEKITRELIKFCPQITNHMLGKLVRPSPLPTNKDPEKIADCYRGRGKMLKKMLLKEKE